MHQIFSTSPGRLSLFIRDNPKTDDKRSDDVTTIFLVAGCDANSKLLVLFMYEVSVIYWTIDHGTVSNKMFYQATSEDWLPFDSRFYSYCCLLGRIC